LVIDKDGTASTRASDNDISTIALDGVHPAIPRQLPLRMEDQLVTCGSISPRAYNDD
jgi:hypothetical protein